MKLIRLTKDQVSDQIHLIRDCIESSWTPLFGEVTYRIDNLIKLVLNNEVGCYAIMTDSKFSGLFLARVIYCDISRVNSLLVLAVKKYGDEIDWNIFGPLLMVECVNHNCKNIVTYTFPENENVIETAKQFGASIQTCIILPVRGE